MAASAKEGLAPQVRPAIPARYLDPDEVAAHLGIPKATLYAWRSKSEGPPAVRVGKHLRYPRAAFDAWCDQLEADAAGG
jgi:excisionase family DNA binding protein